MKISFKKRLLAFCIALLMLVPVIPSITPCVQAAGTLTVADSNIGLSWTDASNSKGSAAWSASGSTVTGTATGYTQIIFGRTVTTTLTITNNNSEDLTLAFDWTLANGGSVSGIISGTSGTYSETLAAGSSVTITMTSPSGANTNTLTISGLQLLSSAAVTSTFNVSENGSYTVDGTPVVATTEFSKAATEDYTLSATPDSEYIFFGWWSEASKSYVSYSNPATLKFGSDPQLKPVFLHETTALFGVGESVFSNLTDACQYALSFTSKTVVLLNNGTVTGSHTIPAGVTLLVPFDDANTLYTNEPGCTSSFMNNAAWVQPTAYRTLTLAADAKIIVNGAISVSAKHAAANGNKAYAGSPTGPVGFVNMTEGSNITVNSGANLYAWGFITGAGSVTAKSGSNVYENFQFTDFRGGTNTTAIANEGLVFPMNQYYVQNIEVPVTFESGASEYVYTSVYSSSMCLGGEAKFIGEGGMFIAEEGSSVTKDYIENRDRLQVDLNGDSSLNSLTVKLSIEVDSSKYILPITNNVIINIKSGTTTLNQSVAILPGVEVSVDEGAVLDLGYNGTALNTYCTGGHNLIVYDRDEWFYGFSLAEETMGEEVTGVAYAFGSSTGLREVIYAPGRTYTRTAAKDLNDAVLDINGTLIANGFVYTTVGGAAIKSSGKTGVIKMVNGAGYDMITCQANGGTSLGIMMNSAMLLNGDGSYLPTIVFDENTGDPVEGPTAVAGDIYNYCADCDQWVKRITLTYNPGEGTGSMDNQIIEKPCCGEPLTLNSFTNGDKVFAGWAVDGSDVTYADGSVFKGTENAVLTATWKSLTVEYVVTFKNEDGSKNLVDPFTAESGTTVTYSGTEPTKLYEGADDCHFYQFRGWSTEVNGEVVNDLTVTGDVTYYAVFELKEAHQGDTYLYEDNGDGTHKVRFECCGSVVTDNAAHTEATLAAVAPTCTQTGLTEGKYCSDCKAVIVAQKVESSLGHSWGDTYTSNGNGAGGTHYQSCTVCSEKNDAVAHDWDEGIINPDSTCTEEGVKTYTCKSSGCGATYTEVVSVKGHTEVIDEAKAPTCTDTGLTQGSHCSVCGAVIVAQSVVNNLGHEHESEITTAPGCETVGVKTFTCSVCGDNYTEEIPATGHSEVIDKAVAPTCTETGLTEGKHCDICDKVIVAQNVVGSLGHSYESKVTTESTCEATGVKTFTCSVCGDNYTEVIPATGHTEVIDKAVAPTCTETGLTQGSHCSECDKVLIAQEVVSSLGHSYEGKVTTEPACEAEGVETFTCSACGDNYTEVIPETGHNYDETTHICKCGKVEQFKVTWIVDGVSTTENYDYGTTPSFIGSTDKAADENFTYTLKGWNPEIAEVSGDVTYTAVFAKTGFTKVDGNIIYLDKDVVQKTGWTAIDGEWYYFDTVNGYAAIGNTRVCYPSEIVDGNIYTANADDKAYWESHTETSAYTDAETALFVFDESGKFESSLTGIVDDNGIKRCAKNGMIGWHAGLVQNENDDYYYFIGDKSGGGNVAVTGNAYVTRVNNIENFVKGGIYTFGNDGKLCKYDGIVEIENELYYYENWRLATDKGLFEIDGDYYYVQSSGENAGKLAVNNSYWITANDFNISSGLYEFDSEGKLINPISTQKNGIYNENGSWYYYVAGKKTYAGAIEYTGAWIDESGKVAYEGTATIYVNSSGKLATGKYWPSKNNGVLKSTYNKFDEYGKWICVLDGIVEENGNLYYYKNGTTNPRAGLVKLTDEEGKVFYIYVRSSTGTLATGRCWPSLRNDLLPAGYYDFGTDGRYYPLAEEEIEKLDGIVEIDGNLYYYEDGETDPGAGLVQLTDEEGKTFYIYVRSSTGTLATGRCWPSLRNDLLPAGYYDFGTDGRYYPV
ncbi:MAG: hypothetical protein IJE74_07270 [Clostridia bacterium]|nr:hypothetical protein [Clostridia bacterium]